MNLNRRELLKLGLAAVVRAYITIPAATVIGVTKKVCSSVARKLTAKEALGKWVAEQIDEDMIYAASGLKRKG